MARKVTLKKPARPDEGRDDLAIIHPEITRTIAGRAITLREYGFVDGLRLRAHTQPFVLALEALFQTTDGLTDDVMAVVGEHYDLVRAAIAQSAGVEVEWIEGLRGDDAELLLITWWEVCGPFFVRQLLRRLNERARRLQRLGGAASSQSSPALDSAPPASSDATPPDSCDSSTTS
jgi:hypothetical protein